jgi:hypothetical protein
VLHLHHRRPPLLPPSPARTLTAPARTATGGAILANDPHLSLDAPALWYLARIVVPGIELAGATVPTGMIALMWGDPSLGRTKHPNALPNEAAPDGHWYDWIRIRKATTEGAVETTSTYGRWPTVLDTDNGAITAQEGTDPTADQGKNTVYLAQLPAGLVSGDVIRIHANCLTHGEYVDFLTIP